MVQDSKKKVLEVTRIPIRRGPMKTMRVTQETDKEIEEGSTRDQNMMTMMTTMMMTFTEMEESPSHLDNFNPERLVNSPEMKMGSLSVKTKAKSLRARLIRTDPIEEVIKEDLTNQTTNDLTITILGTEGNLKSSDNYNLERRSNNLGMNQDNL